MSERSAREGVFCDALRDGDAAEVQRPRMLLSRLSKRRRRYLKVRRARVEWIVSISPIEVDRIGEPWSRRRGRLAPAASCPRAHSHWVLLCHGPPRPVRFLALYGMCMRTRHERLESACKMLERSAREGVFCDALRGGRAAEVRKSLLHPLRHRRRKVPPAGRHARG